MLQGMGLTLGPRSGHSGRFRHTGACPVRSKLSVVYVAKLADAVYVLHCFQKKTQQTAKREFELAQKRLKELMKELAP